MTFIQKSSHVHTLITVEEPTNIVVKGAKVHRYIRSRKCTADGCDYVQAIDMVAKSVQEK